MARVTPLALLGHRSGPLRVYQWLWLLTCTLGALAVVVPRVVAQPIVFHTTAQTRFDARQYAGLYNTDGTPSRDFAIAIDDASHALQQRFFAQRELRFGLPDFRIIYAPQVPGDVQITGIGSTPAEATQLADAGAEELARQIQAAGGREILRNLLNWEYTQIFRVEPPTDAFAARLRTIIEVQAFPLSRVVETTERRLALDDLPLAEQGYLARALESRADLWRFEINTRNATLDAICKTAAVSDAGARANGLHSCAATDPAATAELAAHDAAVVRLQAIDGALGYLVRERSLVFAPDAPGPVYRVAATTPTAPVDRQIPLLVLLATLAGLVLGAAGIAVDRSSGVTTKARELWAFRALIGNMVLRDLRVRYHGSALGYLWTQLAPLLLMLVFWLVFSVFLRSDVAMFPVFLLAGLLPWNFCGEAVSAGARSVIDNAALVKKVYFPREVLPLAAVLSALLNFVLSLPMLLLIMAVVQYLYPPLRAAGRITNLSWTILYLPVLMGVQTILMTGIALGLSALAVRARDTVHLIGIGVQFWFFLTPVVYALDSVGGQAAQLLRWFNPMASLIEFYREVLYGSAVASGQVPTPAFPAVDSMLRVFLVALAVLAAGYWFFRRQSGSFGERL